MNSLPLISHHLFVAAVSNEDRAQEGQQCRQEQPADLIDCSGPIPLELLEGPDTFREAARRASRSTVNRIDG